MKCIFCGHSFNKTRAFQKYCSSKCVKRAWYVRHSPRKNSYHISKEFWKTETGIGFKWEKYVAKLLGAKHLEFNKFGADLDWKGKLVDVKSAHLHFRKSKRGKPVKNKNAGYWVFHSTGKPKEIDYVFCVGLSEKERPIKRLLIPFDKYPKSGIVVGWESSYDIYSV